MFIKSSIAEDGFSLSSFSLSIADIDKCDSNYIGLILAPHWVKMIDRCLLILFSIFIAARYSSIYSIVYSIKI